MYNNSNLCVGASDWLSYIQSIINEAMVLTINLDECNYFLQTSNHEKPSQNHPKLPDIGDGKCYFLCMKCKWIKKRVLMLGTLEATIHSIDGEGDRIEIDTME